MTLALNPVAFQIGSLSVRWYGILMATGVLVATLMAISEGKKRQIMPDDFIDFLLWAVPIGFICARIYYVIFEWGYFSQHPDQIIAIWNGGIAIYGGLIGGIIVLIIFCHVRMLPIWLMLDIIAPGVMAAQVIARWGNFMNQEAHGIRTTLAFLQHLHLPDFIIQQMYINGHYYQPTYLYESFFNLIGLIIILSLRHKKHLFKRGEIFLSYVIWYSCVRFFVEGMRTDSLYIANTIRVSQALSLVLFFAAIIIWIYRRNIVHPKWYLAGSGLKYPYNRD
ncbi:prolipoprotein diacylglyceryl transferase [Lactobacillus hominis]|uniref:Phosphatidylglycerol--prolipoprotein diacylglyceryl transferase n=1 Tax=Lactobacillus hominis DSM 23910 = CRBIP 24.179 TaxID=1423758 RepID=I7IWB2_9LACO|nr:prolipoprotein diacylglyceryl transferase [Lactobacillus hominis]KRM86252.1 prolipoprotein diacylglyceryl transferase [Lactobacillus hominis DSM 23910 = CRBIP 24.179]MCT3348525.1 prolipoprotein diacylglyceryl transferase [Lactobacillus hominis]CCI82753.1 Prolipoprotein diacylglyceryl transferase [Lactobacillus hominis DSM 23910 = CRBIP 24.179]